MIIKIRNGIMYSEDGRMLAVMTEEATERDEKNLEFAGEAAVKVEEFIEKVNRGKFTPRTAVKEFENLLNKYEIEPS